jgi:iron-sulfur cluster insertion protein
MNITLTKSAADKITEAMILDHRNAWNTPNLLFRIHAKGGGGSGMQYVFSIEDTIQEDDTMIEQHNIKMIVDPFSYPYVDGVIIDFEKKLFSSSFVIKNPNTQKCLG